MSGNKVQDKPKPKSPKKAPKCGAKTKTSGSKCQRPAGWGTKHAGKGRCKLHGGSSTGPTSQEGKRRTAANAIKHGAYSDKLLSELEKELHDILWDSTIIKHNLDQEDAMTMATLKRACMTYIKLIRLDEWEMREEIVAAGDEILTDRTTGKERLKGVSVFNERGEVVGTKYTFVQRLRSNKTPNWEGHFQRCMTILGVDRGTQVRMDGANSVMGAAVDALSWFWGGKSDE